MIIAIDYDGTIADTNREKVRWIEEKLGRSISPWLCNRTDCVPIIGVDAYEKMGAVVYEKEQTLQAIEVPGAIASLRKLSDWSELHLVTARPPRRMAYAQQWLENNGVAACFNRLHSSEGSSKAAVCADIGADILIDDDIRHLQVIQEARLHRILLQDGRGVRPECSPDITFCSSWQEVINFCAF